MKIHRSKTLWFSCLLAVLGVVQSTFSEIRDLIPDEYQGLVLVGVACCVAVLRVVTTQPLSDK